MTSLQPPSCRPSRHPVAHRAAAVGLPPSPVLPCLLYIQWALQKQIPVHHHPPPPPRKTFHRLLFALGKTTHMLNDLEGPLALPWLFALPPWPGLFWFLFFVLKAFQSFFREAFQVPDMNPPHSSPALAAWAVFLALYRRLADSCCSGSDLSSGCTVLTRLCTI